MSRIRIMGLVLVIPVLLVMLQVSNVFACTLFITTTCTSSGKTEVVVKGDNLNQVKGTSGTLVITSPSGAKQNVPVSWKAGAGDTQVILDKTFDLAPGTYKASIDYGQGLNATQPFDVHPCTAPTPTPTPAPTPTPTPTPTPSSTPTPPATFPQPSVAVACTDTSNATLTVTVTDNGSYAKAGKGNVQVFAPNGSQLDDIAWTWDANGPKTQNIATIQIQGQNTSVNGTWKLVVDGHPETAVQVNVSCSTGGGAGSGTPGLPDTGLAG